MKSFSINNQSWDFDLGLFIGGRLNASNLSAGFHGLLQQWWEFYPSKNLINVLLMGENNVVKKEFQNRYKNWNITTLDFYTELGHSDSDILVDICTHELLEKYDLIISQANLEHIYDPFGAMKNLCNSLNKNGYIITHSCAQFFQYHPYPRDYIRFMTDWWYDLPNNIKNIELIELYEDDASRHIFTCYRKQ